MGEFSSISLDYSFQSWNKTKCFLLPVLLIITELSRHWKWRHFRYRIFFFFLFISIVRCPLIPPKEVALFRTQRRCGHTTLNEASLLPHLSKKSKTPKTAESRDKLLMMSSNNICLAWFTDYKQSTSHFTLGKWTTWLSRAKSQSTESVVLNWRGGESGRVGVSGLNTNLKNLIF